MIPLFAPLPVVAGGFRCIHADPPLRFRSNSHERPGRNVMRHYRCYDYAAFEVLRVADIVAAPWPSGSNQTLGTRQATSQRGGFLPFLDLPW